MYFGEVHLSKFVLGGSPNPARRAGPGLVEARGPSPWSHGKKEDDVMMLNNRSTHAPGSKLLCAHIYKEKEKSACTIRSLSRNVSLSCLLSRTTSRERVSVGAR